MFCRNCGAELSEYTSVCPNCGFQQTTPQAGYPAPSYAVPDTGHIGWGFLGFFFPVVGLVLFLVWSDTKPRTAKIAGKGALAALIAYAVFAVLWFAAFIFAFVRIGQLM